MLSYPQRRDVIVAFGGALSGAVLYHVYQQRRRRRRQEAGIPVTHPKLRAAHELLDDGTYPAKHFCWEVMSCNDPKFIARMDVKDDAGGVRQVLVLLKSAEGYATVVRLENRSVPARALNRVPCARDYEAVALAASQVAAAFLRLGIFPQMELLGNNSHCFVEKGGGYMQLGNEKEAFFPHIHVIGRGDIAHAYAGGAPLRGKRPGEVMVPRLRTEKWACEDEARAVAKGLAASIEAVDLHPDISLVESRQ